MTRGTRHHTSRILFGNDRWHWMTKQVTIARRRGESVAAPVVVFVPIGPCDVRAFGVRQPRSTAASIFPNRIPGFFVDQQMKLERVCRRALEEMFRTQPR